MTTQHDWIDLLRTGTTRFAELLASSDPTAAVEHCPGWSVRDVAVHLGGIHQWVVHAVEAGDPHLEPEPPASEDDLADWYAEQAGAMVRLLADSPADRPAWTLDRDDRTVGFWRRRQVHEVLVHTWDVEHAVGAPRPIDPALAWDGVREVVDVLLPRQVRLGRTPDLGDDAGDAVRLVATDLGPEAAATLGDPADGENLVEVRAEAERLLLLLWHRADATDLDPRAAAVLGQALTP